MVKVSIICTNYNKGSWIDEAINSFLKQETSFSYEIIIVDDASTDCSVDIIHAYQEQHPDLIRAFFNQKNQGITRTWVEICKEARGQYIARCDGDDYWTDPFKLQKQIDLLEASPESKWSNTDFDMADSKGNITHKDVLKNNIIPFIDSYEKMLALKGMTMASTWLAETELVLEVNNQININAVDDTFNIQLELFKKTKLAFLKDSTTVYRMDAESDSRSKDFQKLSLRFDRLLETQFEYIEKYPDSDYRKILEFLLPKYNDFEKRLSQQNFFHSQLNSQQVTVYFANEEQSFSQENALVFPLRYHDNILFEVPEDTVTLRIDLSELPSFYRRVALTDSDFGTEILPNSSNGELIGNYVMFKEDDPQLIYDIKAVTKKSFCLAYTMFNVDDIRSEDYIANILSQDIVNYRKELNALKSYKADYQQALQERDRYKAELEEMVVRYNSVTHSRRWTIPTKLINLFRRRK
ncbi:glycosyltransferase family 2 protein [Streptococcus ferus]|uniref:glycosyltransferase family 2 protein n=1 Tax=Streptococcus ferus TaxID=1345 RepID=UPI0035A08FE9